MSLRDCIMAISKVAHVYLFEMLNPILDEKFYFFHNIFIFATNNFPPFERNYDFLREILKRLKCEETRNCLSQTIESIVTKFAESRGKAGND